MQGRFLKLWLLALLAIQWVQADGENFLWKVTKGAESAYVMGSIHAGTEALYPLDPSLLAAFEASEVLAVEADVVKGLMAAQMFVMKHGVYTDGSSVEAELSAELVAKLKETLAGGLMPWDVLKRMKPWVLYVMLTEKVIQEAGASVQLGLDMHFYKLAKEREMPIKEMESVEFQLNLMKSLGAELSSELLDKSLNDLKEAKTTMDQLFKDWQSGNLAGMQKLVDEMKGPGLEKFHEAFLVKRNVGMVEKIKTYAKSGQLHFVIAGAAHFPGEDGILALLKAAGYNIEQVKK